MASSSDQVIELSVDETNRLRAELGLAPLRGVESSATANHGNDASNNNNNNNGQEEVLEMSVEESNALRERLGLPPLKGTTAGTKDQHAPAVNQGQRAEVAARVEKQKLKRQVEEGLRKFNATSLAEEEEQQQEQKEGSILSWAQQMRSTKAKAKTNENKGGDCNKTTKKSKDYGESDLKGLNVAHSLGDLEGGSTTVLTLADTELLEVHKDSHKAVGLNENAQLLENVNLSEQQKQRDGLQEKRKMEMGLGRAGGYAGYDDDEFVELGGTQGPSRNAREEHRGLTSQSKKQQLKAGFQIGAMLEEQEQEQESDLFAGQKGKAVSLESSHTMSALEVGDFMTIEEDEAMNKKKKKKDAKFKKSKKKKDKKEKKKHKRRAAVESDDEDEDKKRGNTNNLLAELEQTAKADDTAKRLPRKRRREDDGEDTNAPPPPSSVADSTNIDEEAEKRSKYAAIMEKGNERTRLAFQGKQQKDAAKAFDDEEPDDAFLNAALSKARRLNRLKQMAATIRSHDTLPVRGEDAVLEMVRSTKVEEAPSVSGDEETQESKLVFAVDETREFTRALRAREEQSERSRTKASAKKEETPQPPSETTESSMTTAQTTTNDGATKEAIAATQKTEDPMDVDDKSMDELAKEIKEEPEDGEAATGGLDGTGEAVTMGRGLGGVLSMLKQTGEISKKNAGREEQRGRAKDERTYEDYESLDLKKVVQLDERTATDKDKELASREIKLEYRDGHGRLLTRKEAFRDLSYQFHGYGSGKRKQEKKLQQIAREQAEQRLSSKQDGGILGALKTTQKATGKAFVVHKTS